MCNVQRTRYDDNDNGYGDYDDDDDDDDVFLPFLITYLFIKIFFFSCVGEIDAAIEISEWKKLIS